MICSLNFQNDRSNKTLLQNSLSLPETHVLRSTNPIRPSPILYLYLANSYSYNRCFKCCKNHMKMSQALMESEKELAGIIEKYEVALQSRQQQYDSQVETLKELTSFSSLLIGLFVLSVRK